MPTQGGRTLLGGRTRGREARACLSGSATASLQTEHNNGGNGFWHELAHSSGLVHMPLDSSLKIQSARQKYLFLQEIPGARAD